MLPIVINFLLAIHVITSLLIILLVLMQRPKNEGLGAAFGGGMTENLFGAQTTNVLQTITRWLGGIFFALTLLLSWLYVKQNAAGNTLHQRLSAPTTILATPMPKLPEAATAPMKPDEVPKASPAPAATSTPAAAPVATPAPAPAATPATSEAKPVETPKAAPAATPAAPESKPAPAPEAPTTAPATPAPAPAPAETKAATPSPATPSPEAK